MDDDSIANSMHIGLLSADSIEIDGTSVHVYN